MSTTTAPNLAMTGATAPAGHVAPADRAIVRGFVFGWVAAGALMMLLLARPDVQRTQEARVLGTAREMLERDNGLRDFLVPHLNHKPRLQKPPLVYWVTAGSFAMLGTNDFAGRLPSALAAWLTVGVTFAVARRHFNTRAAFFAAAALFGSVLFIRYGALAETDVWSALFVTIAIGALMRCFDDANVAGADGGGAAVPGRFALWAHVSAVAIALALLSKGAPAIYPVLFLIAACAARRRWDVLRRWVLAGAPATLLVLAVPWFLYIRNVPEARILLRELEVIATGGGHRGWFFVYFGDLLTGTAPWTGLMMLGVAAAIRGWRDQRLLLTLLWFLAVFVPLCISQQKQKHYLVPALPPLAILTGWMIDRAIRWPCDRSPAAADALLRDPLVRMVKPMLVLTLAVAALAIVTLPVAGYIMRGRLSLGHDVPLAAAITLAALLALWLLHRRGLAAGATALCVLALPAVVITLLYWETTTYVNTHRQVAAAILRDERAAGGGAAPRYGFYAQPENLPVCWALRRVIPSLYTRAEIDAALAADPRPVLITVGTQYTAPMPPPNYVERHRFRVDNRPLVIWVPRQQ
jgi:4-amino-4-deoxy-L-arabinose transferase-like glycosyltransferase